MTITDAWSHVEDVLLGPEPDYDTAPEELDPLDRATADRYLRRVGKLDAEHDAEKEVVQAQIDELQRWLASRYEGYMDRRGWLSARLRRFHEALLAIDDRVKTVKLPAGEIKMRAQPDAWTIDAEAYLPWAKEHAPGTVRTVPASEAIDVRAVKEAFARTDVGAVTTEGEVVPGVTVATIEAKFSIVPNVAEPF